MSGSKTISSPREGEENECVCEDVLYGESNSGSNTAVWASVAIGAVLLILFLVAIFAFAFRGQQTGSQLTAVGEAQANQYKDMNLPENLKVLNMPGAAGLNITSGKL